MGKLFALGVIFTALTGCSRTHYQGVSPFSRIVGDPDRQCYLGLNFTFAVDQPAYHSASSPELAIPPSSPTASAD